MRSGPEMTLMIWQTKQVGRKRVITRQVSYHLLKFLLCILLEDSIQLGRLFSSNLLFVSVNIPCFRSQCEPVSVGPFFYPPRHRSVISPVTSFWTSTSLSVHLNLHKNHHASYWCRGKCVRNSIPCSLLIYYKLTGGRIIINICFLILSCCNLLKT